MTPQIYPVSHRGSPLRVNYLAVFTLPRDLRIIYASTLMFGLLDVITTAWGLHIGLQERTTFVAGLYENGLWYGVCGHLAGKILLLGCLFTLWNAHAGMLARRTHDILARHFGASHIILLLLSLALNASATIVNSFLIARVVF